jgi:hypothetical protein
MMARREKRCEELREQEGRNKFGAPLFSLSFYYIGDLA